MSRSLLSQKIQLITDLAHTAVHIPKWISLPYQASGNVAVNKDAFGVNVASAADPRCDDYVIQQLREADINYVRLAWDADSSANYNKRFLERLLAESIDVMVSLVPTFSDAGRLESDDHAADRWRVFLIDFFTQYGKQISCCEIGNTPNRPSWSGYTLVGYLKAWQIACAEAEPYGVKLAGPNISDFEPAFNAGYLRNMQRAGLNPSIHTDNLFVERSKEPEQYDPSALGSLLAHPARLNLVKKINIFREISHTYGAERTFCTYTCWTSLRLARWSVFPAAKGSDYLVRYLVICAASGGLDRVYWGPLIDRRDGLIDCGNDEYPKVDNVTNYKSVRGTVDKFTPMPCFFAYKFITNLLKDSYCHQGIGSRRSINHYIFEDARYDHHITWAPDGRAFDLHSLYPQDLDTAMIRDVAGNKLIEPHQRAQIGESPVVLSWDKAARIARPDAQAIADCQPIGPAGTLHVPRPGWQTATISQHDWVGAAKLPIAADRMLAEALSPAQISDYPIMQSLRDKRNKLWTVKSPLAGLQNSACSEHLVVKQNRARGIKRFSYLFTQSKGKRHWNTAAIMLRRGINTPQPIAYAEKRYRAGISDNYYIAEHIDDAFSTRDLFTAFAAGEHSYRGISKAEWLRLVALFVAQMHIKRIIHRDLSSGNILISMRQGEPQIYVIDIGRARIDKRYTPAVDIKRICYKLSWPDRKIFVSHYQQAIPRKSIKYWRSAIYSYELKQVTKKRLKGLFSRRRKTVKPQQAQANQGTAR